MGEKIEAVNGLKRVRRAIKVDRMALRWSMLARWRRRWMVVLAGHVRRRQARAHSMLFPVRNAASWLCSRGTPCRVQASGPEDTCLPDNMCTCQLPSVFAEVSDLFCAYVRTDVPVAVRGALLKARKAHHLLLNSATWVVFRLRCNGGAHLPFAILGALDGGELLHLHPNLKSKSQVFPVEETEAQRKRDHANLPVPVLDALEKAGKSSSSFEALAP